ncbi:hypothetical protein HYV43_02825 [Candidatus Micrarchaeota archaeon]|nr:hypothetical protein [Candidatus Micrarchaeota archaeon]
MLEVIEHEFNVAPFPTMALGEAVTGSWKAHLGLDLTAFAMDLTGTDLRWIVDMPTWNACCKAMFDRAMSDPAFFPKLQTDVVRTCNDLWAFAEPWKARDFSKHSNAQLANEYAGFMAKLRPTFEYGVQLVLLDFNPPLLTNHLQAIARSRFGPHANEAFVTLTTNVDQSTFAKQQELDFLRILTLDKNEQSAELKRHAEMFGFLSYGLRGPLTWTESYFMQMAELSRKQGLDAAAKLAEHGKDATKTREKISQLEKALAPEERHDFAIGRTLMYLKPWRKEMQCRTYPLTERLLKEIARRLDVPFEYVRYMNEDETRDALKSGHVDSDLLAARKKRCFVHGAKGKSTIYAGNDAEKWTASVAPEPEVKTEQLQGTPATVGKAQGAARIVNTVEDMTKMQQGDILLSVATNPFLLPAIKKASAIVTDQGGLTCHAAIVSREFGIPCIVGTRHATKAFKDGDRLDVDAHAGVVKKI